MHLNCIRSKSGMLAYTWICPFASAEAKAARTMSYRQNISSMPNIIKPIPKNHVRLQPMMLQRR